MVNFILNISGQTKGSQAGTQGRKLEARIKAEITEE